MQTRVDEFNYEEAVKYLLDIPKFVKKTDEDTIGEVLKRFGNPQDKLKIIHIAGTNGKGSTCAFLNSILLSAGKSVGMFTSPHLVKINERIKINGVDVNDKEFLETFIRLKKMLDEMQKEGFMHLSFFEMLFVLAVLIFEQKNVEYTIFETGLGGRLDATNVVKKPCVTIITTVSMDHMEILGDTIEEIAAEKAGIIKPDVPVIYYGEDGKVVQIIENRAKELGSKAVCINKQIIKIIEKTHKAIDFCFVNMYDKYGLLRVPFVMEYQVYNCALAITALNNIEGLQLSNEAITEGLANTKWAGRMQEIIENVYLDGAHNEEGLREFVGYVGGLAEEVHILFSVVKEKDYMSMVDLLNTLTNVKRVIVAPVQGARALAMDNIIPLIKIDAKKSVEIIDKHSITEAFEYAVQSKDSNEKLFCVGSLYMVGEIMEYLEKGLENND